MHPLRFADLCGEFSRWLRREVEKGHVAGATWDYYQSHLRPIVRAIGDQWLDSVSPLLLSMQCQTWHQVQCVQRLYNWAIEFELHDKNPAAKLKKPDPGQRERTLERAELLHLLRSSRRCLREILLFLRETICRPGEARAIRWEDWHPQLSCFLLKEYKAKKRRKNREKYRVLILTPRAERLILRLYKRACQQEVKPTGPVFLNTRKQAWSRNALRLQVRRLCDRLGLNGEGDENIVAYTIRHTMATEATVKGMPDRILADIMGHSSTRTTARYQHPRLEHLRRHLSQIRQKKCD